MRPSGPAIFRAIVLALAMLLFVAHMAGCRDDGNSPAADMNSHSLSLALRERAEDLEAKAAALQDLVEATPDDKLPQARGQIMAELQGIRAEAAKVRAMANEAASRLQDERSAKQRLEAIGTYTLASGIALAVLGAVLLWAFRWQAPILVGLGIASVGLMLLAVAANLWWLIPCASLLLLGTIAFVIWRRWHLWHASHKVVQSIEAAKTLGAIDMARATPILDQMQGPKGKALVDELQGISWKPRGKRK